MKAKDWASVGATVATVALTAGAFWLSYEHLHDVSSTHGLTGSRAWAWPACLDLFVVIGELLMLRASLAGNGMDWWAVGLMVTGSGGSIALNVAGVGSSAPTLTYVVAAVPPVAALFAFGALMRQVHQHLAGEPEPAAEPMDDHFRTAAELTGTAAKFAEVPTEPELVPVTLERVPEAGRERGTNSTALTFGPLVPVAELLAGTGRDQAPSLPFAGTEGSPEQSEPDPLVPEPDEPEPEPPAGSAGVPAERIEAAREWLAAEPELTGTEIGRRLGTSDSYGRRVKKIALALETTS